MKKVAWILLAMLLTGPTLSLLAVAVLVNPAQTNPCPTGADSSGDGQSPPAGSSQVVFPLPEGTWVLTSPFGWRVDPISGARSFHTGTDYAANDGTTIMAVADGTVRFAGSMSGYGNAILIDHHVDGTSVTSLYGHMWDGHLYVHVGDQVAAGQHIADVGSNGRSTGPHLHFEIRPGGGAAIDSNSWLGQHGATSLDGATAGPGGCTVPAQAGIA